MSGIFQPKLIFEVILTNMTQLEKWHPGAIFYIHMLINGPPTPSHHTGQLDQPMTHIVNWPYAMAAWPVGGWSSNDRR